MAVVEEDVIDHKEANKIFCLKATVLNTKKTFLTKFLFKHWPIAATAIAAGGHMQWWLVRGTKVQPDQCCPGTRALRNTSLCLYCENTF